MATAHTSTHLSKNLKFMLLACLLPFVATKGSSVVLEKKVNAQQVSKNVFSRDILIDGLPS